jgi:hypothetical protein
MAAREGTFPGSDPPKITRFSDRHRRTLLYQGMIEFSGVSSRGSIRSSRNVLKHSPEDYKF